MGATDAPRCMLFLMLMLMLMVMFRHEDQWPARSRVRRCLATTEEFHSLTRASYFLLCGQEKRNQREGHPTNSAFRASCPPGSCSVAAVGDCTSLCKRRLGDILSPTLRAIPSTDHRCSRGPGRARASCAQKLGQQRSPAPAWDLDLTWPLRAGSALLYPGPLSGGDRQVRIAGGGRQDVAQSALRTWMCDRRPAPAEHVPARQDAWRASLRGGLLFR